MRPIDPIAIRNIENYLAWKRKALLGWQGCDPLHPFIRREVDQALNEKRYIARLWLDARLAEKRAVSIRHSKIIPLTDARSRSCRSPIR
jgi:hypothetical protein